MKKDFRRMKCYACEHRELLVEALQTEKYISYKRFKYLLDFGMYHFYCHDRRIDADRYIIDDITCRGGLSVWINVYQNGRDLRNKYLKENKNLL